MTQQSLLKTPTTKWLTCNGQQLRKLAGAGLSWLEKHHQEVNALNVFPVPDGDTGTNMLLTMRSACSRIQESHEKHVGQVAQDLSQGALMGARGNSGVILSQIWRGLARSLKDKESFDADDLANALQESVSTAYKGVMRPVEGTILTVIREGAEEAQDAVSKSKDLRFLLERVLERCQQALARTPDMLPVLKQAGVTDAGGMGLVFILEGMLRYVYGEVKDDSTSVIPSAIPAQALAAPAEGVLEFPYDVQFLLMGQNLDLSAVREAIDAMGDSTVVVGDDKTIKVHVHVKDPGKPLSYGISQGTISDVVVENMQVQMEEIIGTDTVAAPSMPTVPTEWPVTVQPGQIAVVAVASGSGLAQIFQSLGVARIVEGGQSNNPSTEEIFQAIQDVPTDKVIILPNNKNVILAAEAARDLSPKNVVVVPTRTVPQGISALLSLNPDSDLTEVAQAMEEASQQMVTGEITKATRTVTLNGVSCAKGQYIGLVNNRLCVANSDLNVVLRSVLENMNVAERELISLYYGQDVKPEEAATVGEQVEALYPDLEVELLAGGQAHYFYILGAE